MDAISFAMAAKQSRRIKRFIANPDSDSGVITVPMVISSGETIKIPAGRRAVLPDIVVAGELNVEGEVFVPSGGSLTKVNMNTDNINSIDQTVNIPVKNLLDTTRAQDVSGVKNFTSGAKVGGDNLTAYTGFKNLVVNGDFRIRSRGDSFSTPAGKVTYDKWKWECEKGNGTITLASSGANDGGYGMNIYKPVSSDYCFVGQMIPGSPYLSGKTVTLSCRVYTNDFSNVSLGVWGLDGVDNSLVQNGPTYNQNTVKSINKGSYNIVSTSFTLPTWSNDNYTLAVVISVGNMHNVTDVGNVVIRDVQLELGSVATPFERRPLDLEKFLTGEVDNFSATNGQSSFVKSFQKGYKNWLMNGDFSVDQYVRGSKSSWNDSVNPYVDRWLVVNSNTVNVQTSGKSKFNNMIVINKLAGADTQFYQRLEIPKDKASTFTGSRTFCFSFWCYCDATDAIEVLYFNKNGSSANSHEVRNFRIVKNTVAGNWVKVYGIMDSVAWNYEAGEYIEVRVDPANGIACTCQITGLQLEEGTTPTEFEYRPFALELMLCQRYYEAHVPSGVSNTFAMAYSTFYISETVWKVRKRIIPTVTQVIGNGTLRGIQHNENKAVWLFNTGSGTNYITSWTANAEL